MVWQSWGRNQVCNEVCHFVGRAGLLAARQLGRRGVLWDIYGLKTSHFESFQSWILRNVSHFESFESWRPYKASHFESFRGWGPEKASHFESSGGCRLREVCHGESFGRCRLREVSHGESWRRPGSERPWAWRGGGVFAVPGLGHGASRGVGRWLDLERAGVPVFDGTDMP